MTLFSCVYLIGFIQLDRCPLKLGYYNYKWITKHYNIFIQNKVQLKLIVKTRNGRKIYLSIMCIGT